MLPPLSVISGSACTQTCKSSAGGRINGHVALDAHPVSGAEFIAVDTETNGLGGEACEITEVGAVLVGGGELHDRWQSLVRPNLPLRRGIQRFTGITQAMVDAAPPPEAVLPALQDLLRERVMVAHNAPFDRRVLVQAFDRADLEWPQPPVICTAAMARTLLPLQRERRLGALADALGIEVRLTHRALADAETCARVLCALLPRLCANASTIADALALLRRGRPRRRRATNGGLPAAAGIRADGGLAAARGETGLPEVDFAQLPRDPGVYLFRDSAGQTLYVGKSVSIRNRARAHFAPSAPRAGWTAHASIVDYRATHSELGALVLENRLIKELRPPGNVRLTRIDDRLVYIRCRLDIPFPILEVASAPASGHALTIGPLRGRRLALELVQMLSRVRRLVGDRGPRQPQKAPDHAEQEHADEDRRAPSRQTAAFDPKDDRIQRDRQKRRDDEDQNNLDELEPQPDEGGRREKFQNRAPWHHERHAPVRFRHQACTTLNRPAWPVPPNARRSPV